MYYLGNQRVSSEYLSSVFHPAIFSCDQLEIMMTCSIFATKEDIQEAVFVRGCINLLKQFQKTNIVYKTFNQTLR